uniref:Secreted protein n=1 Tax=Steinernema glaseri TaxID=37863 RepID=A0A1I7Z250_9BILA
MRRIPSFLVGALATLVILVFYLGLHMPQPFLYSVEHEDALSQRCYCSGGMEELCYRLPENESVVGERFKCEFERYLKELGITSHSRAVDLEKDDLPVAPFVTAFSSSHYNEGLTLLSTIRKHFPTRKVIIYDLGIHPLRVNTLKSLCNVEYRRFPFELYPLHVRYLHEYRWKPLLIAAVLNEFGAIWYMDASVRYKKNSLEHIYDLLRCRRRPKPRIYHNLTVSRDSALETGWNRE